MKKVRKPTQVVKVTPADANNQVVTVTGEGGGNCKKPCAECPWRKENAGSFPAEAFRISASTAYDGAMNKFACHMTGTKNSSTCAGFLLRNAHHNIGVRLSMSFGAYDPRKVDDGGANLFDSYKDMAIANGVDPSDPVLDKCRANDE